MEVIRFVIRNIVIFLTIGLCPLEISAEDCKADEYGLNYTGAINVTISGRKCQAWVSDVPHSHSYHTLNSASNYCRNPSRDVPGPWCYTTDPNYRWEFCPVYQCGTYCSANFFKCNDGVCILDYWRCNGIADCFGGEDEINCNNVKECLDDATGLTYRGKRNMTVSGKICQKWSSQTPNQHMYEIIASENYCRNSDLASNKPWCFTIDPAVRWEYCDIPKCVDTTIASTSYTTGYYTTSDSTPDRTSTAIPGRETSVGLYVNNDIVTSGQSSCLPCTCNINMTKKELKQRLIELSNLLMIDKHNTSLYLRTKYSAKDSRISSKSIGLTGAAVLICCALFIVMLDFAPRNQIQSYNI